MDDLGDMSFGRWLWFKANEYIDWVVVGVVAVGVFVIGVIVFLTIHL